MLALDKEVVQLLMYLFTTNAMSTREIKLLHNYFSLCQHPSEIILPEIISQLI